jgi:hypothetical protein
MLVARKTSALPFVAAPKEGRYIDKTDLPRRRMAYAADKLMSIGAFVLIALAFCPVAQPEELPTVAKAVAGLRAITNQDPSVRTVDIDGHYSADGGTFVFRFLYRAPNHYVGLQATGSPLATVFAGEDNRLLVYDPIKGEVASFATVLPSIRWEVVNREMRLGYNVHRQSSDPSEKLPLGVLVDVPSIVNELRVRFDWVESTQGGYRVVGRALRGDPVVLTIDTLRSMTIGIRVGTELGETFMRMVVNAPMTEPVIPAAEGINQRILVKEYAFPENVPGTARFLARMFLPFAVFAPAAQKNFESLTGEKLDWATAQANMKRDSDKLRQALPLP